VVTEEQKKSRLKKFRCQVMVWSYKKKKKKKKGNIEEEAYCG